MNWKWWRRPRVESWPAGYGPALESLDVPPLRGVRQRRGNIAEIVVGIDPASGPGMPVVVRVRDTRRYINTEMLRAIVESELPGHDSSAGYLLLPPAVWPDRSEGAAACDIDD